MNIPRCPKSCIMLTNKPRGFLYLYSCSLERKKKNQFFLLLVDNSSNSHPLDITSKQFVVTISNFDEDIPALLQKYLCLVVLLLCKVCHYQPAREEGISGGKKEKKAWELLRGGRLTKNQRSDWQEQLRTTKYKF